MNTITTGTKAGMRNGALLGLFAGCVIGALSLPVAQAAGAEDAPQIVVQYDARSLATDSGVKALYRRLDHAARQVCNEDSWQDLSHVVAARRCHDAALERAVREIDDPRLAQSVSRRTRSAG